LTGGVSRPCPRPWLPLLYKGALLPLHPQGKRERQVRNAGKNLPTIRRKFRDPLLSFHPETVLFRPGGVNHRACLCGVPMYASAQSLDFLARTKNPSFPYWKPVVSHPEFPDGHYLILVNHRQTQKAATISFRRPKRPLFPATPKVKHHASPGKVLNNLNVWNLLTPSLRV
jgi:hypothetical protein